MPRCSSARSLSRHQKGCRRILRADEGEGERELDPLIRGGLVESRNGLPGEPPGFRVNPEAWSVLLSRQLVSLMTFRRLAERGMSLQGSSEGSAPGVLSDMYDLYAYAEVELPALLERFALQRAGEYKHGPATDTETEKEPEEFSRIRETA